MFASTLRVLPSLPLFAVALGGAHAPRGCAAPEAEPAQAEPVQARVDAKAKPEAPDRSGVILLRSRPEPCDREHVWTLALSSPELLEAETPESARILACLTRASQGMSPPTLHGALDGLAAACSEPGAALEPIGVGHEYCGTSDVDTWTFGMGLNGHEVFSWTGTGSWACPTPPTGQR